MQKISMKYFSNAVLLTDCDYIYYFIGFKASDSYLLIYDDKMYFYTDMRYYNQAIKNVKCEVKLLENSSPYLDIESLGIKSVGLAFEYTNCVVYKKLLKLGVAISDVDKQIQLITSKKSNKELSLIKKSCKIAEKAYLKTLKFIKEGVTELEISSKLEYYFKKFGASGTSFDTIVAFGENSAIPHHQTGDTKLKKDMPVLMDFGCVYKGYCSDMTRTIYFGKPTAKFLKVYNSVLNAHIKSVELIKEGILGATAHEIAKSVLKEDGFDKYFTHGLGHGVGVKIHEAPRLSSRSEDVLKNNQVFSIEPGVYLPNEFGVRIEDTVCLKSGKVVSFITNDKSLLTL